MALVETHALTKHYGPTPALRACTLAVREGEVFGLLGPNGSGKTTLLRLLMGFLRPTSGAATVAGRDCYRESVAVHRHVSYLPGEARLFRSMRGRQVLRFLSAVRGPSGDEREALRIAERFELDLRKRVSQMSTGMRQQLALAGVLSARTPLVILDEPTSNLDPTARRRVAQFVREARAAGRAVVFSSHVLPEVEEVCDRVAILRRGELVQVQAMSELRRRHRIRASLQGAAPAPPERLKEHVEIRRAAAGEMILETSSGLQPLLGWLATLPLKEVQIEPLGLRSLYDAIHDPAGT